MMLELHNVSIGSLIKDLSLTVSDGQLASLTGAEGSGKTTLLRAVLGFLPIDGGHICIDGELLTPQSAPYFRRMTAYVPQHLTIPDDEKEVRSDYLWLLRRAVEAGKPLLIVDEPSRPLSDADREVADSLLRESLRQGAAVLAVRSSINDYEVSL